MKKEITRKELVHNLVRNTRSLKKLHDGAPDIFSTQYCLKKLCASASFLCISEILNFSDVVLFEDIIDRIF